jgi:hypothetical protein
MVCQLVRSGGMRDVVRLGRVGIGGSTGVGSGRCGLSKSSTVAVGGETSLGSDCTGLSFGAMRLGGVCLMNRRGEVRRIELAWEVTARLLVCLRARSCDWFQDP